MPLNEADLDVIAAVKDEQPPRGTVGVDPDGRTFRFRVVGRGETAYYQEGDRALLLEVLVGAGVIARESIRWWDDGKRVTDDERGRVITRATEYLRSVGAKDVKVV